MTRRKGREENAFERDDFSSVYEGLKVLRVTLTENRRFLKDKTWTTATNIGRVFDRMLGLTDELEASFKYVEARAREFDVDEGTKASGYWSLLIFTRTLVLRTNAAVTLFAERKNSWFFDSQKYLREIRCTSEILLTMTSCLNLCKQIMSCSERGTLFLGENHTFKELLSTAGRLNQYSLFGRFNSAQLSESLGRAVGKLSVLLAVHSELYYREGMLRALWRCFKIITSDELRAMRCVAVSQYGSPQFFKSFVNLTEKGLISFAIRARNYFLQHVAVNKLILLQPKALSVENLTGDVVAIPVPTSHIGRSPLPIRLLSSTRRSGMENRSQGKPPSDELVIHFHGGGFIGHTSLSHEVYLRRWARHLDCPIVSVDYSLSPEIPFPRPVEEALYAYGYALQRPEEFGSTGKKIVLAGDSAGGLLVMNVLFKIIEYNIRPPDGAVIIYAPFQLAPLISPGRLLNFLDPVLSIGFLAVCSKSYTNRQDLLSRYEYHEKKLKQNVAQLKPMARDHDHCATDDQRIDLLSGDVSESRPDRRRSFWSKLFRIQQDPRDESELKYQMKRDAFNPVPFCLDDFEDRPEDPLLSPLTAPDDVLRRLPPMSLLTADYDPFIDDNIEIAKRFKSLGVKTKLQVLEGLNHGFLNLSMMSYEARQGSDMCCQLIKENLRK